MLRAMTAPVAHVLVVEDEAAIAETVLYALRSEGYAASHCLLGGEALQRLQAGDIDVVVLDVGLPDLGGFEVCRRLRAQPGPAAQLPVIFLTARNDEVDRVLGLELGADDYMTKPLKRVNFAVFIKVQICFGVCVDEIWKLVLSGAKLWNFFKISNALIS